MLDKIKGIIREYFPNFAVEPLRFLKSIVFFLKNYKYIASPGPSMHRAIFQAYFITAFDWKKIDKRIVDELTNAVPSDEGCLLDAFNDIVQAKMPRGLEWASNPYGYAVGPLWNFDFAVKRYVEGYRFYPYGFGA